MKLNVRMRNKYAIIIICVLALVIIEKENNIILRVSDKLAKFKTLQMAEMTSFVLIDNNSYYPNEIYTENSIYISRARQKGEKHILLMATTRTGSSFVGELFNQQGTDMFYLFEPLWHVEVMLSRGTNVTNTSMPAWVYRDVLNHLFLCDFSLLERYINPPPQDHVTPALFRRESSVALCEKEVCSPVIKGVFDKFHCKNRACGPLNLTLASAFCQKKRNRVIKTVRVTQLDTLRSLLEDPELDFRIIQLVRDPRATLASRMVAFPSRYQDWKSWAVNKNVSIKNEDVKRLEGNCNSIRMSAELALSWPKWLKDRYMLVRYEDIAMNPMQKAVEMYNFTGIPFTTQTRDWILKNTNSHSTGIYSTTKNSSEHVEKWRFKLPFKLAQVIQEVCGPSMKLFGYRFVDNEQSLLNKSFSLLEEKEFNFS